MAYLGVSPSNGVRQKHTYTATASQFDGNVTMAGTLATTGNATFSGDIIKSTSGTSNFAAGVNAGNSIASGGNYNVVIGDEAGTALTTGDNNVAIGFEALATEDAHGNSVAIGYRALKVQDAGDNNYNVAVGSGSGQSVSTGAANTFVGGLSGDAVTTGAKNTAIGYNSLTTEDAHGQNTAVGYQALKTLNAGTDSYNTAVGSNSGKSLTTGIQNVLLGATSGDALTDADFNVAIGVEALGTDTKGNRSVAIGYAALFDQNFTSSTDAHNVAVGNLAGTNVTTGVLNTFVGGLAGASGTGDFTDYQQSVVVGYLSGQNQANFSVAVGNECNFVTYDHSIVLGYNVDSVGENHFTFGKGDGSDRVYNQFITNASWTRVSDERYKTDIQDNTDCGLDFINELRTVTFKWKAKADIENTLPDYDASKTTAEHTEKMYGLIAQEVKTALEKHNITNFGGHDIEKASGIQAISQEMFIHPLIKAVQELSAKNDALEARIKTLEGG
jgi:hypothetical protein